MAIASTKENDFQARLRALKEKGRNPYPLATSQMDSDIQSRADALRERGANPTTSTAVVQDQPSEEPAEDQGQPQEPATTSTPVSPGQQEPEATGMASYQRFLDAMRSGDLPEYQAPRDALGRTSYDIASSDVDKATARDRDVREEALQRQLAKQGMSDSGLAFKQQRMLEQDLEMANSEQKKAITKEMLDDMEAYATATRASLATAFQTGETAMYTQSLAKLESGLRMGELTYTQYLDNKTKAFDKRMETYFNLGKAGTLNSDQLEELRLVDGGVYYDAYLAGKSGKTLEDVTRDNKAAEDWRTGMWAASVMTDPAVAAQTVQLLDETYFRITGKNPPGGSSSTGSSVNAPNTIGGQVTPSTYAGYRNGTMDVLKLTKSSPYYTQLLNDSSIPNFADTNAISAKTSKITGDAGHSRFGVSEVENAFANSAPIRIGGKLYKVTGRNELGRAFGTDDTLYTFTEVGTGETVTLRTTQKGASLLSGIIGAATLGTAGGLAAAGSGISAKH